MVDQPELAFPPFLWSIGDRGVQDLATHLRRVLEYSANAALARLSSGNAEEALTSAVMIGLAVETATKYALSKVNPVLVADRRDPRSMAFLAAPLAAPLNIQSLRTVNGIESFDMLRVVKQKDHPRLVTRDTVQTVLDVRNAAVHVGFVETSTLQNAARAMVKILTSILEMEGEEPDDLWRPELLELIDELVQEHASALAVKIASKRARATARYEDLRKQHGSHFKGVVEAISATSLARADGEEAVTFQCPACGSRGVLGREVTDSNLDFTGMSYPEYQPDGTRYAYPEWFECPVCGFALDREEIEADNSFDDVMEVEIEPSKEFYDALNDWQTDWIIRRDEELERQMWDD